MTATFSAPKGTYDLLPPESEAFLAVREAMAAPLRRAGYGYIETPTFEHTALFERGVGESTDVVSKEMYSFTTRGGDNLSLKPEGTAGVVRAVVQHRLYAGQLPVKLWYSGSYYRYERPQAGRYRHFSQVGAEALGVDDPALDAEIVSLGAQIYRDLGLTQVRLLLNSLGDAECRPVYRARLVEFLSGLDLDAETRKRIEINPLRVLDDKRPEVVAQVGDAPVMADSLCDDCKAHYDLVRGYLADLGVTWEETPRLVRGLDYYTRTTFEFVHDGLGSQSAVGGGGRYDGLSEQVGGPQLPGVGWALGVDRTVLALKAESVEITAGAGCEVFAVPLGAAAKQCLVPVVADLRRRGVAADLAYGDRGLKGAMKAADRSGASIAIVVGERDLEAGVAQVKDLGTGGQEPVALDELLETIEKRLR
ncbi:MAG: histidine--tRNA ligase [Frankiaceae bacterium]|nr:histidine--tRNA ligase [Frankiaceae bacterium]MBV9871802.1 histidine--tRNA ligase [Frankiaceae bacterium]